MKIIGNKLEHFASLYENAKTYASGRNEELKRYEEQYKGSREVDGSAAQASSIRNITYEIIETQVDTNIPSPKILPERWSDKTDMNARSVERLCANLRDKLPFEKLNDTDERSTYLFGADVWLVEWDNSVRTHNTVGEAKLTLIDPRDFFEQPGTYRIDDMDYCFMRFSTSKAELVRQYGVTEAVADTASSEAEFFTDNNNVSETDDIVTVIVCYYRNERGEVAKFTWSGDAVLEDIDNYYKRKTHTCTVCGKREELCDCENPNIELRDEEYEELTHDIVCNDGKDKIPAEQFVVNDDGTLEIERVEYVPVTDELGNIVSDVIDGMAVPATRESVIYKTRKTRLPYYTPKTFPFVVRVNTSVSKKLYGQSDCEFLRPQQQDINKIESRIMQKFMRSGITPVLPENAEQGTSNGIFETYIQLKPGENMGQYGTIDTSPNVQQDIQQAERIYAMAKRTLGITDTFQGFADASARSGAAKQIQVAQASGRLASKRIMKQSAYSEIDRIIFEFYLAYADEPRPVSYKDEMGRTHGATFNRYDFIHLDTQTGEYYYDDSYLFSVDTSGAYETNKEAMWQQILQFFQMGMYGAPNDPMAQLRVWQQLEKRRFPDAHDMVEYLQMQIAKARQQQAQMAQMAQMSQQNPQQQLPEETEQPEPEPDTEPQPTTQNL